MSPDKHTRINKRQSSEGIDASFEKKTKTSSDDDYDEVFRRREQNRYVVPSNAGSTPAKINTGSTLQVCDTITFLLLTVGQSSHLHTLRYQPLMTWVLAFKSIFIFNTDSSVLASVLFAIHIHTK